MENILNVRKHYYDNQDLKKACSWATYAYLWDKLPKTFTALDVTAVIGAELSSLQSQSNASNYCLSMVSKGLVTIEGKRLNISAGRPMKIYQKVKHPPIPLAIRRLAKNAKTRQELYTNLVNTYGNSISVQMH